LLRSRSGATYRDCRKLVLYGDVDVGGASAIHGAESTKYLGSIVPGHDLAHQLCHKGASAVLAEKVYVLAQRDVIYEGERDAVSD
jgi:hypothetical protein